MGGAGLALAVIVVGGSSGGIVQGNQEAQGHGRRGALLAIASAGAFGVGLYSTGHAGADLPVAWVVLPARAIGVLVVTIPLALTSRLRLTRRALPLAVSAVLASQFAVVAAIGAYALFGERLGRIQLVGVVLTVVGVTLLTGLAA